MEDFMNSSYSYKCAALTMLLFGFSSSKAMQPQIGIMGKLVQATKKLTCYVPSMQGISSAALKAKSAIVTTIKGNRYIAATIGASAALLTSAYIYFRGCRWFKRNPSKEVPVSINDAKPIETKDAPTSTKDSKPVETTVVQPKFVNVETINDSDQPLEVKVMVPARTHVFTQLV